MMTTPWSCGGSGAAGGGGGGGGGGGITVEIPAALRRGQRGGAMGGKWRLKPAKGRGRWFCCAEDLCSHCDWPIDLTFPPKW